MNQQSSFLNKLQFCVIDLEATGGVIGKDEIIEVGLVHIDKLKLSKSLQFKIKPDRPIPKFVQKLTSLTPEKLEDSPKIDEIIDEITQFIGDRILVAHNTAFDIPFLNGVLKKLGRPQLKNHSICTNVMTKYLLPESVSSNLTYLAGIFNVPLKPHRALEDAKATGHILLKYLDIFDKKGIRKLNHIYYPQNKFELDRLHIEYKHKDNLKKIFESKDFICYLVVKDEQGSMLACFIKDQKNQDSLINELAKTEWSRITLYFTGTYFESLRRMNLHLNKMPPEAKEKSLDFLKNSLGQSDSITTKSDYILIPHIISGQYTLYDLKDLHPSKRLILKYPGHEKKLLHFLRNSQKKKNKKSYKERQPIALELKPYFDYLYLEENMKHLMTFQSGELNNDKELMLKIEEKLFSSHQFFKFPDQYL